jgi:hypothetical protein
LRDATTRNAACLSYKGGLAPHKETREMLKSAVWGRMAAGLFVAVFTAAVVGCGADAVPDGDDPSAEELGASENAEGQAGEEEVGESSEALKGWVVESTRSYCNCVSGWCECWRETTYRGSGATCPKRWGRSPYCYKTVRVRA